MRPCERVSEWAVRGAENRERRIADLYQLMLKKWPTSGCWSDGSGSSQRVRYGSIIGRAELVVIGFGTAGCGALGGALPGWGIPRPLRPITLSPYPFEQVEA
jgi:hypothetical protein